MIDWERFVLTEGEKLLNYVNKIVGDIENAKDIVHDAFLASFENMDRIEENYLLPWLYRTAHNKAVNFAKRHQRLIIGEVPEQIHYDNTEEELRQQRLEATVKEVFSRLKPKYALVLELQFYQKKSYKEIAEMTGMSLSKVENLLVRAKKRCKKIMKELLPEGVS